MFKNTEAFRVSLESNVDSGGELMSLWTEWSKILKVFKANPVCVEMLIVLIRAKVSIFPWAENWRQRLNFHLNFTRFGYGFLQQWNADFFQSRPEHFSATLLMNANCHMTNTLLYIRSWYLKLLHTFAFFRPFSHLIGPDSVIQWRFFRHLVFRRELTSISDSLVDRGRRQPRSCFISVFITSWYVIIGKNQNVPV